MPVHDLLCLAYSRKLSARCVAGLRLDTLEWLRPVSETEHGALPAAACRLNVGRAPRPLDLVRLRLKSAVPERHQPENWLVGDREWELVDEVTADDAADYLKGVLVTGPELLGTMGDSIDWERSRPTAFQVGSPSYAFAQCSAAHRRLTYRRVAGGVRMLEPTQLCSGVGLTSLELAADAILAAADAVAPALDDVSLLLVRLPGDAD